MRDLALKRFDSYKRMRDFGNDRADSFSAASYGKELFDNLNGIIAEMDKNFQIQIAQHQSGLGETVSKAAAKAALYDELKAISRTARVLSHDIAGLEEKFRLPVKLKEQEALSLAKSFAEAAAPYEQEFIKHEMASDFLAQLNASIAIIENAMKANSDANAAQVAATAAIDDAIERAMVIIDRLDVIIKNKFHNDKLTLHAWATAKHVVRSHSASTKPAPPEPASAD